ncbi:MAG: hypothetical protein V4760_00145 [Bdellovibrionota bacterium]
MTKTNFSPPEAKKKGDLLYRLTRIILSTMFAGMLVVTLHPEVRTSVRGTFVKDFRVIVSTAKGNLAGDDRMFTVAKVKTRDSLALEIFEMTENGSQRLVEKIEIADAKDGYFSFNGKATNLVIDDIDGDGRPEILAPSFDTNLVGRLNVYNYDQSAGGFQRIVR